MEGLSQGLSFLYCLFLDLGYYLTSVVDMIIIQNIDNWQYIDKKMYKVGFEPTPFRNRALIYRLGPLGHLYLYEYLPSRTFLSTMLHSHRLHSSSSSYVILFIQFRFSKKKYNFMHEYVLTC